MYGTSGYVNILVAMNAFKGSLSSVAATRAFASGLREGFPGALIFEAPLADGGDGTLDVIRNAFGSAARTEEVQVHGPLGAAVKAPVLFLPDGTAVIESALACGLSLIRTGDRDPWRATTYGLGELIRYAVQRGSTRILVGIGGTATNDGGIGMAQALGALVLDDRGDQVPPGISGLVRVSRILPGELPRLLHGVTVLAACDVSNPLAGPDGATATYGPQKGIRPDEVTRIDEAMRRYGEILERDLGTAVLTVPRTGAGGGLGAALKAFLGAELLDGAEAVITLTGVLKELERAHLVVTGEGRIDFQTRRGKAPHALAERARALGKPVIAVAGGLAPEVIEETPVNMTALFSTCPRAVSLEEAMENAEKWLRFSARQLGAVLKTSFALGVEFSRGSQPHETERCYGGIMVRRSGSQTEVLLIKDRFGVYAPPKGHPEEGEGPEEGARREVLEETGIDGKVLAKIGDVEYAYLDGNGTPVKKKVTYYLMTPGSGPGEPRPQAGETLEVVWVPEDRISCLPFYPNNLGVVKEAVRMFRELSAGERR